MASVFHMFADCISFDGFEWTEVNQHRFHSINKAITAALLTVSPFRLMLCRLVIITDVSNLVQ